MMNYIHTEYIHTAGSAGRSQDDIIASQPFPAGPLPRGPHPPQSLAQAAVTAATSAAAGAALAALNLGLGAGAHVRGSAAVGASTGQVQGTRRIKMSVGIPLTFDRGERSRVAGALPMHMAAAPVPEIAAAAAVQVQVQQGRAPADLAEVEEMMERRAEAGGPGEDDGGEGEAMDQGEPEPEGVRVAAPPQQQKGPRELSESDNDDLTHEASPGAFFSYAWIPRVSSALVHAPYDDT